MRILICDDLKEEADSLSVMLDAAGYDTDTIIFTDAQKALEYVSSGSEVDCCFLDIIMQRGTVDPTDLGAGSQHGTVGPTDLRNGIELAERLRDKRFSGEIIFLTSSNDFAHESYKVKAFDYLLKPPTRESVRNILHALENERKAADQKGLMVKIYGRPKFILYSDISHAEVVAHTVYIRLIRGNEVKVYSSFAEIASRLLGDERFIQCHRSYIVNTSDIETVTEKKIIMRSGAKVPISRMFSQVMGEIVERIFAED